MSDNLLNILSNSNKDIDNQLLMAYLNGELSATEAHDFEEEMLQSPFTADAVEGLDEFKSKSEVQLYAEMINRELQKKLGKKKRQKEKKKLQDLRWLYFSIILILLLAIISFIILKFHLL